MKELPNIPKKGLPNIPGTDKPQMFDRISNTVEHWIISYYFKHEKEIDEGISILNNLSQLEEILELPIRYHEKLKKYHDDFSEGYTKFLKEKYDKNLIEEEPYTHPIDKIRKTNEGIDYISFVGKVGIKYLPVKKELQGKGELFIDKNHPIILVAPDKTIYKYWGIHGLKNIKETNETKRYKILKNLKYLK